MERTTPTRTKTLPTPRDANVAPTNAASAPHVVAPTRMKRAARRRAKAAGHVVRPNTRRRIEWTFYLLAVPLVGLSARLVYLQGMESRKPNAGGFALAKMTQRQVLPARRADILASDGSALAVTLDEYTVTANPRAILDKPKMAQMIASAIGGDANEYSNLLQKTTKPDGKPNYYVRLARHISEEKIEKLRGLMQARKSDTRKERSDRKTFWEPISLEASPRRAYPMGNFASQLIGFTDGAGRGVDGLEWSLNKKLGGKDGVVVSQVDARNRPIPGQVDEWRAPVAGQTVVTTIEPEVQAAADKVVAEIMAKYKPQQALSIVMRPSTGEIVAMATAPSFDLNNRPKNVGDLAANKCINFAYEPGSTFKMITACASVEQIPDWQSKAFLVTGAEKIGKHIIHDWTFWGGHNKTEMKTLSDGIRDSSNITMWHFAHIMGAPTMLDYAKKFKLGEPIKIAGLRGQSGWLAKDPKHWSAEQLANFSFGQGMMVTPLQLIRIAATVANNGVMMKPMLVKELRGATGQTLQTFQPESEGQIIKPETAQTVTGMMERVTREGTARKYVFVPGYQTAGKTGSAQKSDGKRGYSSGRFISSFVGFLPSRKPEYVVLVLADEPHGSHWGSEVCGPAFAEIAQTAMMQLRLEKGASAPAPQAEFMKPFKAPTKE